ncbi:hypothetical protein LBMAG42_54920 [Deltaproteobacteria bacterium]|nr:hypothetical protein LBMAG42_54920 [Deltaproteobacteria bacterium]
MKEGRRDEAALAIERLRQLTGLEAEASTRLMAVSDALEVVLASKESNPEALLSALDAFLAKHQPALPPLDEELVDELLEAPMSAKSLPLPPEVFAAVHFLRARALATVLGQRRRPVTDLAPLREPLLRALQFRIQHREVLGVLGALWFWFVPEQRREGVRLLERASRLGTPSLIVARLLQVEQETEATRRDLLEWFRSASIRVLRDPTLSAGVREALVRDLAQFREHQPLLLELEEGGATTLRDPTLPELIGRSRHVSRMADHVTSARGDATRLRALGDEHGRLLASLATAVARLQELEREVVGEAGRTLTSGSEG